MINTNELRIGNWVMAGGGNIQVFDIQRESVIASSGYELNEDLSPVPITVSILESVGFTQPNGSFDVASVTYEKDGVIVLFEPPDDPENIHGADKISFGYKKVLLPTSVSLHHLQNLYYSLTGKELEVNL